MNFAIRYNAESLVFFLSISIHFPSSICSFFLDTHFLCYLLLSRYTDVQFNTHSWLLVGILLLSSILMFLLLLLLWTVILFSICDCATLLYFFCCWREVTYVVCGFKNFFISFFLLFFSFLLWYWHINLLHGGSNGSCWFVGKIS